ncbi:MAG: hypothetical protein Kapaf2KO_03490 [Candidatus Kapaibacteriales bacterium]
MKRKYNSSRFAIFAMALMIALGAVTTVKAQFVDVELPKLSLTGEGNGYNDDWYPDGRIRVPQSEGQPRQFLVPVFIENQWDPSESARIINGNTGAFIAEVRPEGITSFEFSVFYDSSAVRFLDVVSTGQIHNLIEENDVEDSYDPIAAQWDIKTYTRQDTNYLKYLLQNPSNVDRTKGWKTTITATSSRPLPLTFGYEVLCYLQFEAVPDINNVNTPPTSLSTPLYLAPDTVKYNGMNIVTDHPWDKYLPIAVNNSSGALQSNREYRDFYLGQARRAPEFFRGSPEIYRATTGINNFNNPQYQNEPTAPGTMYLIYTDLLPILALTSDKGGSNNITADPNVTGRFILNDPISTDASQQQPLTGERLLRVFNNRPDTRLRYLEVETDQEWLKIDPVNQQGSKTSGIFEISDRKLFVNYLDNGFLGSATQRDPENRVTDDDGDLFLNIIADPRELNNRLDEEDTDPNDPEKAGVYKGTITFYSPDAQIKPVELEITFYYFRIPQEACQRAQNVARGVKLDIRNSSGQLGDRTRIIFGTGNRATGWTGSGNEERGVDSLFGEFEYSAQPTGFWARFFPVGPGDSVPANYNRFGYGDWAPNSDNPRSASRDIRSNEAAQNSVIYHVRFNANGVNNYPIVIEWDVRDLRLCDDGGEEQLANAFIRDTANGQLFPSVNMREATVIDANRRSYAIQDPAITSFIIEYTLPNVIEFVDEFGNPIIKQGWNLLSLPVDPTNKRTDVVYDEAIGQVAFSYANKFYEGADVLKVGLGYFVKFGQNINRTFSGTSINEISIDRGFPVRLYPGDQGQGGWNLIGALSRPISIEGIAFDQYQNNTIPTVPYTRQFGVWGYEPGRGYYEVSELLPGLGYWIKVDGDGYLNLSFDNLPKNSGKNNIAERNQIKAEATTITVADAEGNAGDIYLSAANNSGYSFGMPPVLGPNAFDVRFSNNTQLTDDMNNLISVNGAAYPLELTVDNPKEEYVFFSAVTGEELGRIRANSNDVVKVTNSSINLIGLRKVETAFGTSVKVYPNPTADNINVDYLASEEGVTITVVNTLGTVVASANVVANGNGTEVINIENLPSGTYLVKVEGGENSFVSPVSISR